MANILNTTYSFLTEDTEPPYLQNLDPDRNETGVAATTSVAIEVVDDGSGVDASSVVIAVDAAIAWTGDAQQPGFSVTKTTVTGGFRYVVTPATAFVEGATVTVEVEADDFGAPVNHLTDLYTFTIFSGPPYLSNRNPGAGVDA